MDRTVVVEWLRDHPDVVHGDVEEVVSRCERAVRRHAREDAWIAAKEWVTMRQHEWEESHGAHASEAFVAREVCRQLATELQRHEPTPHPGDEEHLAGAPVKSGLEQRGWEFLIPWIMELARAEEHRAWSEVVGHTKRRARDLIRQKHLSDDTHFDQTKCYGDVAARVAGILAEDYSEHAFPRRPAPEPSE
jgi:hypothetical protein